MPNLRTLFSNGGHVDWSKLGRGHFINYVCKVLKQSPHWFWRRRFKKKVNDDDNNEDERKVMIIAHLTG